MDQLAVESASAIDPALQPSTRAAAARGSWRSWRAVVIALGAMAVAIALLRLQTYDEPFEADLAIYMYVGRAITSGPGSSTADPPSEARDLGRAIKDLLRPGETLYQHDSWMAS